MCFVFFFFFKQKTAYEMRISDWSSDVCSSDLEFIGYDRPTLAGLLPALVEHGVAQLEQPLGRGREADLDGLKRPLPFVADESALSLADPASLVGRFDIAHIKLDKSGGLTEEIGRASGRERGC